ncbi:cytochrome c oxidase subunit II [Rhodocaloribacter litoris]|uniref:cytochrome c oxidase subunit II n=1 Tax=Rhodocaloribacter litoris TaxID=2558931 RepID=UPI00141E5087|nr:cytochrome c oxidase subunit II [Rhodocaloribacter litoris]QXD15954.1 cytochrome c oxidase subunit II [Rhodocaloribacter litoris]GIV60142.1 MAG: cytochrome-c oxidase [Rhodothermaceae bacterium]
MLDISHLLGLPPDVSTHGHELDYMTGLVHWLMLLLFVGWGAFFLYTLFRFRQSKNPKASYEGARGHFSTYAEGGVVLAEVVLLFIFAIPTWAFLKNEFPPAGEALVVHAVGEQFAWNFHYPGADGQFGRRDVNLVDAALNPLGIDFAGDPHAADDIVTVNELHVPVGRPVIVHVTSKDVIHSFSLPNLRVKQDAIPGLDIPVWFEATQTGRFDIGCAQLCGLGHYRMHGWLTIHTPEAYEQWMAERIAEIEEYGR